MTRPQTCLLTRAPQSSRSHLTNPPPSAKPPCELHLQTEVKLTSGCDPARVLALFELIDHPADRELGALSPSAFRLQPNLTSWSSRHKPEVRTSLQSNINLSLGSHSLIAPRFCLLDSVCWGTFLTVDFPPEVRCALLLPLPPLPRPLPSPLPGAMIGGVCLRERVMQLRVR